MTSSLFPIKSIGVSIALLTLGILMNGKPWQLLMLASAPLVFAVEIGQWSPLIMASWFWPSLGGILILIKPQTALPIFLARFRWFGVAISCFVLVISLIIMPSWPWKWLQLTGKYDVYQVPVLLPLGILLLLSLLYYSEAESRLLFFSSVLPYRTIYDFASLALIPQNAWQMTIYVVLSWLYLFSTKIWEINILPIALHLLCLLFILITYTTRHHSLEKKH